jgi:chromosome segregation ATPase
MNDERTLDQPQPSELDLLRAEMRTGFQSIGKRFDEVDERFDKVDRRFDEVDKRFDKVDQRFDEIDQRFGEVDQRADKSDQRLDGIDQRLAAMDARITGEAAATRRHMDVVAESLRADLNVVIDKTTATGEKVDRLIASNAIEHSAFLEALTDHEVRITRLEAASGTSTPTTS